MTDPKDGSSPKSRKIVKKFLKNKKKNKKVDPKILVDALVDLAESGKIRDCKLIESALDERAFNSQSRVVNRLSQELSDELLTELMDKLLLALIETDDKTSWNVVRTAATSDHIKYASPSILSTVVQTSVTTKIDTNNAISAIMKQRTAERLHRAGELHRLFRELAQINTPTAHYAIKHPFPRDRLDVSWGFRKDCGIVGSGHMFAYFLCVNPELPDKGQIILFTVGSQTFSGQDPLGEAERYYASKKAILPGPKQDLDHVRQTIDRLKDRQLGPEVGETISGGDDNDKIGLRPPNQPSVDGGRGTTSPTQTSSTDRPPPQDSGWDRGPMQ